VNLSNTHLFVKTSELKHIAKVSNIGIYPSSSQAAQGRKIERMANI